MAFIQPWQGLRYNLERLGRDLSAVTAPPYDVIGPDLHRELLAQEYNVDWIDLNPAPEDVHHPDNRYQEAARTLRRWLRDGVLVREAQPALYVCEQEYTLAGRMYCRRGFLARTRLEEFGEGQIYPHEETFPGPKTDRLHLTLATECNVSPLFGLYPDPDNSVPETFASATAGEPDFYAVDWAGVVSRVWIVTDAEVLHAVPQQMAERPLFIADGHHRYETSLAYRRIVAERHGGSLASDHPAHFVLFAGVSMSDPGLVIQPTHRCLRGLSDFSAARLRAASSEHFAWTELSFDPTQPEAAIAALTMAGPNVFGYYDATERRLYQLRLRTEDPLAASQPHRSPEWRRLDTALLHHLLFDQILQPTFGVPQVDYVHLVQEALAHAAAGGQGAFLLPPTPLEAVRQIAQRLEKMPQKSTYFYPKFLTGLVLHPLF
jgi:uncharacterized protein (DUF1015 family)